MRRVPPSGNGVMPDLGLGVLPGLKIRDGAGALWEVITPAEAAKAEGVICMPLTIPLLYPDNRTGSCKDCGVAIQWRPVSAKVKVKLCIECAYVRELLEGGAGR